MSDYIIVFLYVYILRMNTFTYTRYIIIYHESQGSSTNVKSTQLLVKLILIASKLSFNSHILSGYGWTFRMSVAQPPWHVNWNYLKYHLSSSISLAKTSNFKIFWRLVNNNWNKSRSMWKFRETKNIYNHKSIKGIKVTVHTVMELAYKVFDYA